MTTSKRVSKPTNKKRVATPVKNPYVFDPATDKVEWRNPTPIAELERRAKLYLGETDPAQYIHSHKTHRTASEAFRDADYATPIWRCETDWDRTKEYLGWVAMWAFTLFTLYQCMVGFEKWIAS
jgi:hypothetical protein